MKNTLNIPHKHAMQFVDIPRLQRAWKQGMCDLEKGQYLEINSKEDATALVDDIKTRGLKKLATHRIN